MKEKNEIVKEHVRLPKSVLGVIIFKPLISMIIVQPFLFTMCFEWSNKHGLPTVNGELLLFSYLKMINNWQMVSTSNLGE